jgi:lysophospholipase L1-like esterase
MASRILVFGDSIARGYWDREGGWETRLRKFLVARSLQNLSDVKLYWVTYNLGVSGDTTEDLLQRFEFETKQRSKEKEKTMFIFQIGSNDSQFYNNKKTFHVASEKFEINIQKLIDLAKKFSEKIIFIGLTPVDDSKVNPIDRKSVV